MGELSEVDLFKLLMHHVNEAAACATGIAQLRKDARWMGISNAFIQIRESIKSLAVGPSLSIDESIKLLDERDAYAAVSAAAKRYKERVAAARSDYKRGR